PWGGARREGQEELGLDELGLHEQRAAGGRHQIDPRVRRRDGNRGKRGTGDLALRVRRDVRLDAPAVLGLHAKVARPGPLAHGVAQDAAEVHERYLAVLDLVDERLDERVAMADELSEVAAGLLRRRPGADRPEG